MKCAKSSGTVCKWESSLPTIILRLWIETTCTRLNDLTWWQLLTEAGFRSVSVLRLVWGFNWPDSCCTSWTSSFLKTKTRVCCWCWVCMQQDQRKGNTVVHILAKNQHSTNRWNNCAEVRIRSAPLEKVNSCTAQQCSLDWKVSRRHILSCFCQQFAKISSRFLHNRPAPSASTSLFHWNSLLGVGWKKRAGVQQPYEFISYTFLISNNSKKGKLTVRF